VAAAVAIQGSLDLLPSVRARKDLHQIDTSLGGTRYAPFFLCSPEARFKYVMPSLRRRRGARQQLNNQLYTCSSACFLLRDLILSRQGRTRSVAMAAILGSTTATKQMMATSATNKLSPRTCLAIIRTFGFIIYIVGWLGTIYIPSLKKSRPGRDDLGADRQARKNHEAIDPRDVGHFAGELIEL
jgi:hypothetical protein